MSEQRRGRGGRPQRVYPSRTHADRPSGDPPRHHPTELDRLRASLDRQEDRYLDAVVNETLRLRPVVAEVARTPLHPLALTAGEIPAGTRVVACIHLAHTDSARYDDPLAFRPERFLDRQPDLADWLPFGGGIRRCLGAGFATVELREIIRQVVTHASFRAATTDLEQPKRRAVTMMPRHGTRIVVDQLRPADGIRTPTRVSCGRDVQTAGSPS